MSQKTVKIGMAGFGTVGSGVAKIVLEQSDEIAAKTGIKLELACVVDLDTRTERPVTMPAGTLTDDMNKLLDNSDIEIALELIGGTTFARDLQAKILQSGKHVVTANKALLAEYGSELYKIARENNRCIAMEASCAGGISIISALRTGLAANRIEAMFGIVNGTCNYILSQMTAENKDFDEALTEAQKLGFAEADPTLDINGGDSAHKLAILSSIAFGYEIALGDIYVEGIENVSKYDIKYGGEMGYVLKLLAIGEKDDNSRISLRVHPSFIAKDDPLAQVNGSFNAVSVFGNAVGQVMYYGRGAGMMPTASAVVADIIDVALGNSITTFNHLRLKGHDQTAKLIEKIGDSVSRFYIRIMAVDEPGVFAHIGEILSDHAVSISGVLQHEGRGPDDTVPVVITTHPTKQSSIDATLADLNNLKSVCGKPVCIRIVDIPKDTD